MTIDIKPLWKRVFSPGFDYDAEDYLEYEADEKGHYPYIIAGYRLPGEDYWHVGPFPPPLEKVEMILKKHSVRPEKIQLICSGGAVGHPSFLKYSYKNHVYNRGWNTDYEYMRWYAPGYDIPVFPGLESSSTETITITLIAIAAHWIELQFRQGEKKQNLIFESLGSDGLPGLVFLLKSLKNNQYGHMSLGDSFYGFFMSINSWIIGNDEAYIVLRYFSDDNGNIEWRYRGRLSYFIKNLEDFLKNILRHPDFISQYVFTSYDGYKDFYARLEAATEDYLSNLRKTEDKSQVFVEDAYLFDNDNPPKLLWIEKGDYEDSFQLKWLRSNILELNDAKEIYNKYKNMIENLEIPHGWLDCEE